MSEDEACRRVAASRLARRFPLALTMIERGEIHLTGLLLLREHMTDSNHVELLQAAAGKTKAQLQELLATHFPRADAPSLIRAVPELAVAQPSAGTPASASKTSRIEPLSSKRYKVQFTASAELKKKIERAADLMRHANPNGDLAVVLERALDLLLVDLEKRRLGKASRPTVEARRSRPRAGYVTRAIRHEVFERDGRQCTFVDETGRRCESRSFLELDHIKARALGGTDEAINLRVRCRSHNRLAAERDFGREYIEKKRTERRASRPEPAPKSSIHPRQRVHESETALLALIAMGFKESQAHHALTTIAERTATLTPSLETIIREALSLLT
ncbi:hypothetical protein LZC95_05940 [Pendulispora brunnea]|uniref:HNH nuclease domain-containing protein n=1 Tax=Pendulispora brunnea TaxID=2905690 RepID=A0ABZ2KCG0_9BACT